MTDTSPTTELDAVQTLLLTLSKFDDDTRSRIIRTLATFFGLDQAQGYARRDQTILSVSPGSVGKSEERQISPKEFLFEKQPQTNVERIGVLAYYLTHYRSQPYFKTLDLSILNTEAAQPKFTNAAYAANDALKAGLLAQGPKGQRQISALGEQFVLALPDRDAARAVLTAARRRRPKNRKRGGSTAELEADDL